MQTEKQLDHSSQKCYSPRLEHVSAQWKKLCIKCSVLYNDGARRKEQYTGTDLGEKGISLFRRLTKYLLQETTVMISD